MRDFTHAALPARENDHTEGVDEAVSAGDARTTVYSGQQRGSFLPQTTPEPTLDGQSRGGRRNPREVFWLERERAASVDRERVGETVRR